MPATMTFLANFDGNLSYRNTAGTGTLTQAGTVTYTSGFFSGKQAAVMTAANYATLAGTQYVNMISPASGAIAVRFRRDTDAGALQNVLCFGNDATDQCVMIRVDTSDRVTAVQIKDGTAVLTTHTGSIGTGSHRFAWTDWNGTAMRSYRDGSTVQSNTRTAPDTQFFNGTPAGFGINGRLYHPLLGTLDCVAVWNAPLTSSEYAALEARTAPWAWGMSLATARMYPVLKIGSSRVGPLRVGEE